MIQQLKKLAVLYLACLVAGTLALTAVYCLPVKPIQEHVRVSVDAFLEEGDNPFVLPEYKGSSLDNTTDAIMLGNAVYQSELPAYQAAMKAGRAELDNEHTQLALKKYLDQDLGLTLTSYERYWHGYLVVLKPLLLVFNSEWNRHGDIGAVDLKTALETGSEKRHAGIFIVSSRTVSYGPAIFIAVFDFILCRDRDKSVSFMQI